MKRHRSDGSALSTLAKVLSLRFAAGDLAGLDRRHLALGLLCVWLAGIGRYWDHPGAEPLQRAGAGSLVYVFVLAALLWLVAKPLRPSALSYRHLLTMVTLTAPPALLYAIPVERLFDLETARAVNVWFLALVALWRVVIYALYLRRWLGFRGLSQLVSLLLPLCLVVAALSALNLEQAVFEIMAGIDRVGTANDDAYFILLLLTLGSLYAFPVLLILYILLIVRARRRRSEPGPATD